MRVDSFIEVHGTVHRKYSGSVTASSLVVLDASTFERVDGGICFPGWGRFLRPELSLSAKLLNETFVESMSDDDYERSIHDALESGEEMFKL